MDSPALLKTRKTIFACFLSEMSHQFGSFFLGQGEWFEKETETFQGGSAQVPQTQRQRRVEREG